MEYDAAGAINLPECYARARNGAGSQSHGWSAGPLIHFGKRVLGIRQVEAGNPRRYVVAAGVLLLERLDLPASFVAVGGVYAALCLAGMAVLGRRPPAIAAVGLGLLAALGAVAAFRREPIDCGPGQRLIGRYQGRDGLVSVVEDANGSRHIRVDQAYTLNGTEKALAAQRMEGWLPLVLHAAPRRVLFIGAASGISAGAVLDFPVAELAAVEISPAVSRAARDHFGRWNRPLFADPRARTVIDDGRHVLRRTAGWDLIICDLFNPVRAGASQMYAREFFAAAAGRLAPGGRMVLWLAAYQFDEAMMGSVLRGFAAVFPRAILVRANFDPAEPILGAVGGDAAFDWGDAALAARLAALPPAVAAEDPVFFRSVANLRLAFVGDLHAAAIPGYLASFPANTDDRPIIAFAGPKRFAPGARLHGINLLRWGGTRFLSSVLPSCALGGTPAAAVVAGQRAGNHYYAAAAMRVPLPERLADKAQERERRFLDHLGTAVKLAPESSVRIDDLGR